MYYTSNNKKDLEEYNAMVTLGEGYNGTTQRWANIIEHKDGGQFAIMKNDSYIDSSLTEVNNLDGWFVIEE